MSAEVTIIQTENGWKVIGRDATHLNVEVIGDEVIVKVRPTPQEHQQPLDVKLGPDGH